MIRRFAFLTLVVSALAVSTQSQNNSVTPRPYFTDPAVSPNRSEIAFVSGGDIWAVAAAGGEARLLISHLLGLPTVLVTNQHSLSDAEGFTEGYRSLKPGKVTGEPTAAWIIYTSNVPLLDGHGPAAVHQSPG